MARFPQQPKSFLILLTVVLFRLVIGFKSKNNMWNKIIGILVAILFVVAMYGYAIYQYLSVNRRWDLWRRKNK